MAQWVITDINHCLPEKYTPTLHSMMATVTPSYICTQCGEPCTREDIVFDAQHFCCNGCKTAYTLINKINSRQPVTDTTDKAEDKYSFLDDADIQNAIITVKKEGHYIVEFTVPAMHCASCVYVLEHLDQLDEGITYGRVNFSRKRVTLSYDNNKTTLRKVVALMDNVGYTPDLNRSLLRKKSAYKVDRGLMFRIAVAGFCLGNIMMLSFPDYLTGTGTVSPEIRTVFMWLSMALSFPAVFYSADSYFKNTYRALRNKLFDIDVPIALGMAATFIRGIYEVVFQHMPGYFDSLTGLIFFLLVGRWFQQKTFAFMAFERDNEAYMPLSAIRIEDGNEVPVPVMKVKTDDVIRIKSREIVAADGVLTSAYAIIDYSFVTGESTPVYKVKGEVINAGGINAGRSFDIQVLQLPDQSYLLTLWNTDTIDKTSTIQPSYKWINDVGKYFTYVTLALAFSGGAWWYIMQHDIHVAVAVFTAVLIVACPCALAIAMPFTQGHVLRILGKRGFYLKSADVIEQLRRANALVFDKTGTITEQSGHVEYSGTPLTTDEQSWVKTLVYQSMHPLSRRLAAYIDNVPISSNITYFKEATGKGVSALVDGHAVKAGSIAWVAPSHTHEVHVITRGGVHVAIDGVYKGYYHIEDLRRDGINNMLRGLRRYFDTYLITGDSDTHRDTYTPYFDDNKLFFNAKPADKMNLVEGLKAENKKVLMVGDGLNDAAALKAADAGIAVFDKTSAFIPASDAMLAAAQLQYLPAFLRYARIARTIVLGTFGISFIYNIVAVWFALQGKLVPVMAAVLMPLSSITIVILTTASTYIVARYLLPKYDKNKV